MTKPAVHLDWGADTWGNAMERYHAVIVWAGAAGLSAATCAASLGARVLLLDCNDGSCSDFAKSGGGPAAAGTSFQAIAGVVDVRAAG